MHILSYVVTFPATTSRKTFFGTPTGPTQTSLFKYVSSRSIFNDYENMLMQQTVIFHAHKNDSSKAVIWVCFLLHKNLRFSALCSLLLLLFV